MLNLPNKAGDGLKKGADGRREGEKGQGMERRDGR